MNHSKTIYVGDVPITLPATQGGMGRGGFALGVYKGGSTLLYAMIRRAAAQSSLPYIDFISLFHNAGVLLEHAALTDECISSMKDWLLQSHAVFGGWREFPLNYQLPLDSAHASYLLVRDPRDCITSHYFSLKYSHSLDGTSGKIVARAREKLKDVSIDEFALAQVPKIATRFLAYDELRKSRLMLRRYEDVIYNKERMLLDICGHFEIDTPSHHIKRIAEEADKRPTDEDVNAHVRQVSPGDHKRKLKQATVESLNESLAPILSQYGYL